MTWLLALVSGTALFVAIIAWLALFSGRRRGDDDDDDYYGGWSGL